MYFCKAKQRNAPNAFWHCCGKHFAPLFCKNVFDAEHFTMSNVQLVKYMYLIKNNFISQKRQNLNFLIWKMVALTF